MLLGNYTQLNANPGTSVGGFSNPYKWMKTSNIMSFYLGDAVVDDVTDKSSFNNGYLPPYTFVLAPKSGGIAMNIRGSSILSTNLISQFLTGAEFTGNGDMTSTIIGYGNLISSLLGDSEWSANILVSGELAISFEGHGDLLATVNADGNIEISLSGSGDISAELSKVSQLICAMSGSGTLSADALLLIYMLSSLDGEGELTASITGRKSPTCSMTGVGNLTGNIKGLASVITDLLGNGDLDASIESIANMNVDIVMTGAGLTTSNVGAAVWAALQSDINDSGTAGAALLAAGSAGDPWSTALPGNYEGTQAGSILAQIQLLIDELHKIEGLDAENPMIVTQTSRTAGDIVLDITGDGETETMVTRND